MKAFADAKLNLATMIISLFDKVDNTVGKGENAGHQHFRFSTYVVFSIALFLLVIKSKDCVVKN